MKFKPNLKMSRTDVEVDGKQVRCPNSSWLGYSTSVLSPGDFFIYSESEAMVGVSTRLGRMHYKLEHESTRQFAGMIVAQVAVDPFMSIHAERWIYPNSVLEVRPTEHMDPEIVALFERRVSMWR